MVLFTFLGGIAGGVIAYYCAVGEPRNRYVEFAAVGLGVLVGAGTGFGFGISALLTGTHPAQILFDQ